MGQGVTGSRRAGTEAALERYLVRAVRAAGGEARKVVWPGHAGAPDRLVLFPGVACWVELKRSPQHKPTARQLHEHQRLRLAGQQVVVLSSRPEIDAWLIAISPRGPTSRP